uniref:Uncharacterized protein n=1 Tax=Strigamia maritima TaxID=126957 RepID=T1IR96_STRMM
MAKHIFSDFAQDENWYCSDLWDSGMWSVMWQTLAWALREDYQCLQTNTSSTTTESGSSNAYPAITLTLHPLISPVGLAAVFDFLVPICNDETSQFVSLMMESGDQPLQVLIISISCRLLDVLNSEQSSSSSIVSVLICLNQLLKVVSRALPTVVEILLRDQTSRRCFEALLKHSDAEVRTCTCSIIANLLKDASNDVVEALNDDDNQCGFNSILTALVSVVEDEDENASKVKLEAIYAVGSAFCHSLQPLPRLESSIAPLYGSCTTPI